jgi:hypothetical protein
VVETAVVFRVAVVCWSEEEALLLHVAVADAAVIVAAAGFEVVCQTSAERLSGMMIAEGRVSTVERIRSLLSGGSRLSEELGP